MISLNDLENATRIAEKSNTTPEQVLSDFNRFVSDFANAPFCEDCERYEDGCICD